MSIAVLSQGVRTILFEECGTVTEIGMRRLLTMWVALDDLEVR